MEKNNRIEYITEITKYCLKNGLSLEILPNTNKSVFEIHKDKIVIEFNEKDNKFDYILKMNLEYLKEKPLD